MIRCCFRNLCDNVKCEHYNFHENEDCVDIMYCKYKERYMECVNYDYKKEHLHSKKNMVT